MRATLPLAAATAPPARPQVHRPLAAALWMMGSISGFSMLAIAGRALSGHLDTFEMMTYRSAVGIVAVVAYALASGRWHEVSARHLGEHAMRNVVHFAGQNFWLLALALIPLAQLFALEFSYPILVALTAPLFLGERLDRRKLLAALLGFAGILIVARPFGHGALNLGILCAFGAAFGFAGSAIFTKRLTRKVGVLSILFWLTLMQTVFGLVLAGRDGHIALPDAAHMPWVLVMGISGIVAHLGLTTALSLAPASIVTPIDFLRLPVIGVVGMLMYAEPLDPFVFLGGAIIFAANWINIAPRRPGATR